MTSFSPAGCLIHLQKDNRDKSSDEGGSRSSDEMELLTGEVYSLDKMG